MWMSAFARRIRRSASLWFDHAPDFMIPNEFNPRIVIAAKVAEDDVTARDKVTRVQHLVSFQAGRGFPSCRVLKARSANPAPACS